MAVAAARDGRLTALASPAPGVSLWALDLRPRPEDRAVALPDAADRERLAALPAAAAAALLARRALLRRTLARVAGCVPEALVVGTGAGPRWVRAPGGPRWYVSSSSSGPRGLLAVSVLPVGADLERRPGPPDALQVSRELLPTQEHRWVLGDGHGVADRFLAVWTRKESVVKCTGRGLATDLRSFVVDASAPAAPVRAADGAALPLRTYGVDVPGHAAAVAVAVAVAAAVEVTGA